MIVKTKKTQKKIVSIFLYHYDQAKLEEIDTYKKKKMTNI